MPNINLFLLLPVVLLLVPMPFPFASEEANQRRRIHGQHGDDDTEAHEQFMLQLLDSPRLSQFHPGAI
jgi:hypothetical protein